MEEMRNPDQVEQPAEKLLWLVYIAGLWTCTVDNKQQTSSRLKKTADDLTIKKKTEWYKVRVKWHPHCEVNWTENGR